MVSYHHQEIASVLLAIFLCARCDVCTYGPDSLNCTLHDCETCDQDIGCVLSPGFCLVNGNCAEEGHIFTQHNGLSYCQMCIPSESTSAYSPAPTGTWCNDGQYCNGVDSCVYHSDSGYSQCEIHSGDPCLGQDFCNNTCKEAEYPDFIFGCAREDKILCDNETACASFECSSGACIKFLSRSLRFVASSHRAPSMCAQKGTV